MLCQWLCIAVDMGAPYRQKHWVNPACNTSKGQACLGATTLFTSFLPLKMPTKKDRETTTCGTLSGWWFGIFFIFPYIGNNHPNWLLYFSEGLKPPTRLFRSEIWAIFCHVVVPRDSWSFSLHFVLISGAAFWFHPAKWRDVVRCPAERGFSELSLAPWHREQIFKMFWVPKKSLELLNKVVPQFLS